MAFRTLLETNCAEDSAAAANGIERLRAALNGTNFESGGSEGSSFAAARAAAAALNNAECARRWSTWEAARAVKALERSDAALLSELRDLAPSAAFDGAFYTLSVFDFVALGLEAANAPIESGHVRLSRDEALELLRNCFQRAALESLYTTRVPQLVALAAKTLKSEFSFLSAPRAVQPRAALRAPCIERIASGLDEGTRYYGALTLAIAAKNDRLPIEGAQKLLLDYAARCKTRTHAFTKREALAVVEWVYGRSIRFSCKKVREFGFGGEWCKECKIKGR